MTSKNIKTNKKLSIDLQKLTKSQVDVKGKEVSKALQNITHLPCSLTSVLVSFAKISISLEKLETLKRKYKNKIIIKKSTIKLNKEQQTQ